MKAFIEGHGEHEFMIVNAYGFVAKRIEIDAGDVRQMINILNDSPQRLGMLLEQLESRFPEARVESHSKLIRENDNLRTFVQTVAHMCKDGEVPANGDPGWGGSNRTEEDKLDSLDTLIDGARQFIERNPK